MVLLGGNLMDVLFSLADAKEQLQDVLKRQVGVLRHLLISLHDEHNAITARNQSMLDHVLEERLCIISAFEGWSEQFVILVQQLVFEAEIPCDYFLELRHCEALDILQECLDPEDCELLFLYKQVKSLIDQIHHQNEQNATTLRTGAHHLQRVHEMLPVRPKPKSAIGVMEVE